MPRDGYEVIVVDDGSTDDTRAIVAAYPGVRLLAQQHAGPAAARNLGVQHGRGEIILFTDADCVAAEDWVQCMATPFQDAQVVGVKGAYSTGQRSLMARFVQLEYEDKYDHMARDEYIDFIDTYAAGYRRQIFLDNGGFDTCFPGASVEDQEFSFRLARQHYKMVFARRATVRHLGHAASTAVYCRKKYRIGYWKVYLHRRHPDKLLRDSHTPQVLKIQILLAGGGLLSLVAGLFAGFFRFIALGAALLFLISTWPFTSKAWGKDRAVAVAAPGLLFVRALALGCGFAAGLVTPAGRSGKGGATHV